jgi:hypothetical protein
LRTSSSTSSNLYARSNELVGLAGRVGAVFDQSTSVRTIVAFVARAWSSTSARFGFQRKATSSWKPTYIRGAELATAGDSSAARAETIRAATRKSVTRFTGISFASGMARPG